jgi:predicted permease
MSLWSRITNTFRGERLSREIAEELQEHVSDAVEDGRNPAEARRALGSPLHHAERSRDLRLFPWLDSLRADTVFAWRQLNKRKVTSAAAILSLALAIGACTSAFRLMDALLWRPLPISHPERLYLFGLRGIDPWGNFRVGESSEYPIFQRMRAAVKDSAEMIAVSYTNHIDLTYGGDSETEKAYQQYVSGSMFSAFGIQPAAGRLLTPQDDVTRGAHPYAVLSYDYWRRRFARDPNAVGRTFRTGNNLYTIVGVAAEGFTGTETGTMVEIFVPTMMNPYVDRPDSSWFRALVQLKPGADPQAVLERLRPIHHAFLEERVKTFAGVPKSVIDHFLADTPVLEPAGAGRSEMQRLYRRALVALGVLVALVLLIACANVANLMTAQAAARAREMALRVSIGAGRWRLVQLVLVESACVALIAGAAGAALAAWSAPFLVGRINPADNPARLALPADWRVLGFGLALALAVTLLFGLAPALRASSVKPALTLKGGDNPHARRRLMHTLIAVQVAFCFVVFFAAGLFITTFERLSKQSTGFDSERLLILDTVTSRPLPHVYWDQVADRLRAEPGVESVAVAGWALVDGNGWNGFIRVNGVSAGDTLAYFLNVTPGWLATMKIPLLAGRDFREDDASPNVAIVSTAFVKRYFPNEDPIGKYFEKAGLQGHFQIVGVAADVRYRNLREPITPTAYVPFRSSGEARSGAFLVRTAPANPMALASALRRAISQARPDFRVSNARAQSELVRASSVRERLLAMLAIFFASVALLLSAIGLYGVLDYSVLQRRREIGIRMALGARSGDVARRVTIDAFVMVLIGAAAGLAAGLTSVRYIETLLYQVKATDLGILVIPSLVILAAAALASLPAVIRAVRIDPAAMLRSE